MAVLDISEVVPAFPDFRVALVLAEDLRVAAGQTPELAALIAGIEARVGAALRASAGVAEIPAVRCWRAAYRSFGVKKTSYRSSIERLLKAIERGAGLPRVNSLVDVYNAVSARHLMAIGADDLDRVTPPLAFRYARPGDSFIALGDETQRPDPPKPGEVVYADAVKCLCRRWNWYQDDRSAISLSTRRAVLTVQTLEPGSATRVDAAAEELCRLLQSHCGARTAWAVADRASPMVADDALHL